MDAQPMENVVRHAQRLDNLQDALLAQGIEPVERLNVFSIPQLFLLRAAINQRTSDLRTYIVQRPDRRDPHLLPGHISDLIQLRIEFEALMPSIPHHLFRSWTIELGHFAERLNAFERYFDDLVRGAPELEGSPYERLAGGVGGSRRVIDEELLWVWFRVGFTDQKIAELIGCDRKTILRRRHQLGMDKRNWEDLDPVELVPWLQTLRGLGSENDGERTLMAGLKIYGLKINRETLRLAMRLLPQNNDRHRCVPLFRRMYMVPWINSLWHIDGCHELIKYKMVIVAGIDGLSRKLMFAKISDNNRSETMFEAFMEGRARYGIPSRVRGDYGGENVLVKRFMEEERGLGRGSFIQGRSVHNQRIERWWGLMKAWGIHRYRDLFDEMVEQGTLDVEDPFDMYALHYYFLPVLRGVLTHIEGINNNRSIRTGGNRSPEYLWEESLTEASRLGLDPVGLVDDDHPELVRHRQLDFHEYGRQNFGVRRRDRNENDPHVEVPDVFDGKMDLWNLVENDEVQSALRRARGQAWPPASPEQQVERYKDIRLVLEEMVEDNLSDASSSSGEGEP